MITHITTVRKCCVALAWLKCLACELIRQHNYGSLYKFECFSQEKSKGTQKFSQTITSCLINSHTTCYSQMWANTTLSLSAAILCTTYTGSERSHYMVDIQVVYDILYI